MEAGSTIITPLDGKAGESACPGVYPVCFPCYTDRPKARANASKSICFFSRSSKYPTFLCCWNRFLPKKFSMVWIALRVSCPVSMSGTWRSEARPMISGSGLMLPVRIRQRVDVSRAARLEIDPVPSRNDCLARYAAEICKGALDVHRPYHEIFDQLVKGVFAAKGLAPQPFEQTPSRSRKGAPSLSAERRKRARPWR